MFVDEVTIEVSGGKGGNGALSFRREKYVARGGPDGGNGGRGGSIILKADYNLHTLLDFRYRKYWKADDGRPGSGSNRQGAVGKDLTIPVPVGTIIRDENKKILVDLVESGQTHTISEGGKGGRGNQGFKSSRRQAPRLYEKGLPGENRTITLELKLIADVGLIGYPNAGKSTLLSRLSAARPKIADYPFTTLEPQLGVVDYGDGASFVIADLPGLITGAHAGAGKGDRFLRHAERSRLLIFLVDASEFAEPEPLKAYHQLRQEVELYSPELFRRPHFVVGSKMDLPGTKDNLEKLKNSLSGVDIVSKEDAEPAEPADTKEKVNVNKNMIKIIGISAITGYGLEELKNDLVLAVEEQRKKTTHHVHEAEVSRVYEYDSKKETVYIEKEVNGYRLKGGKLEELAAQTDFDNDEALRRFHRYCRRIKLDDFLKKEGVEEGDTVRIGDFEFDFTLDEEI